jgi:hypothetical protein
MIKGITGGGGLIVNSGSMSYPYIPQNANNPIQGMLRLNGQDIQTFDGLVWVTVGASYASVSLDSDSLDLLQWARTQRQLEMNRKTLIENNPALQKAYKSIKRAEANFDILYKFVENDLDAELREMAP